MDLAKGELVLNCDYDEALDFSEGYGAVKTDNKAGFIDEDGKEIGKFDYDETRSVHNGLAFAKKDGKWLGTFKDVASTTAAQTAAISSVVRNVPAFMGSGLLQNGLSPMMPCSVSAAACA